MQKHQPKISSTFDHAAPASPLDICIVYLRDLKNLNPRGLERITFCIVAETPQSPPIRRHAFAYDALASEEDMYCISSTDHLLPLGLILLGKPLALFPRKMFTTLLDSKHTTVRAEVLAKLNGMKQLEMASMDQIEIYLSDAVADCQCLAYWPISQMSTVLERRTIIGNLKCLF